MKPNIGPMITSIASIISTIWVTPVALAKGAGYHTVKIQPKTKAATIKEALKCLIKNLMRGDILPP